MHLAAIVVGVGVALFLAVLYLKRSLYYRPDKAMLPPILNYRDIYIGNLHGWYLEGTKKTPILFCHGNAGNISYRQEKIRELSLLGFPVLVYDYSGYGKSVGTIQDQGQLCYDSRLFFQLLLDYGFSSKDIIPYGESMGAFPAMYLASTFSTDRVILESPLPGVRKLLRHRSTLIAYTVGIFFDDFCIEEYLAKYKGKILAIHSTQDEVIPIECVDFLRDRVHTFLETEGGHNSVEIPWKDVGRFLTQAGT